MPRKSKAAPPVEPPSDSYSAAALQPQKVPFEQVRALREAKAPPPRIITQKFELVGGVTVTVKGPEGVIRWTSTHDSVQIATGTGELAPAATAAKPVRTALKRPSAPVPRRDENGDSVPTLDEESESLPGDDSIAEAKGREIEAEVSKFLAQGQKNLMRRASQS